MPKSIGSWIKNIADIAVVVLIVLAAKTAIANRSMCRPAQWSRHS
jgi:hypothetical protein